MGINLLIKLRKISRLSGIAPLLIWALAGFGCTTSPVEAPPPTLDVFQDAPTSPIPQADLLGDIVFSLGSANGGSTDVVHPAFSPNGKWLAYANVVVKNKTELTEVWARNLKTGKSLQLLGAKNSAKYAVYSAFVHALKWEGNTRLKGYISDGDVDTTEVTWTIPGGNIIAENYVESEVNYVGRLKALERELSNKPDLPQAVLETALQNSFRIKKGMFVVQKQHAGHDDNIWLLHPHGKMERLLEIPKGAAYYLVGGFALGREIIFMLSSASHDTAHLFAHGQGTIRRLIGLKAPAQNASLHVLKHGAKGVWFLAKLAYSYAPPTETGLFYYNTKGLQRPRGFEGRLHGAAIDSTGRLIAMSLWVGNKRKLVVRRLKGSGN